MTANTPASSAGNKDSRGDAATIPFDSATVTQLGDDFRLTWHASNVARISVYAGTDSQRVGRSESIADGGAVGTATVSRPSAQGRWYFEFVPDRGRPLVLADRSLNLTSVANFRDAGGYRCEDGRWVRMGVAYRSNFLAGANPADYKRLSDLNLRMVCDLRMDEERAKTPNPAFPGANFLVANVLADSFLARDRAELSALVKSGDAVGVTEFIKQVYRGFVTAPSARDAYRLMFEHLADARNLPAVFHCAAGKDRSGWAQAILLKILRVPQRIILQDYALTQQYLSAVALEQVRKATPDAKDAAALNFAAANPAYLDAAFREADERFNSFASYLREGLRLDATLVDSIRANFLSGNSHTTA